MTGHGSTRVAIIGGGTMGGAIASGLVARGWRHVSVVEVSAARRAELAGVAGLTVTDSPDGTVPGAEVVCLLVKPKDVAAALDQLAPLLAEGALVMSMCAGVTIAELAAHLPGGQPVVRVMPNTPARIGLGMAACSPGAGVADSQLELAVALMAAVGKAIVVPESLQDAVTAVSGSGPAYVFHLAESMIEAGVQVGLTRVQASELAVQTIVGAAGLLDTGEHPTILREQVTSPGGTTAAAIRQLDAHGVRSAVSDAVWAAHDRCRS